MRTWISILAVSAIFGELTPVTLAATTPSEAATRMHALAQRLDGHYQVHETHPKTRDLVGEEVWTLLIGGKTLVMNHAVGSGQSYGAQSVSAESGMVWWDSTVSRYRGVLCGDLTPHGCEPFEIQWDGQGDITMSGKVEKDGHSTAWRQVFSGTTSKEFIRSTFFGEDGAPLTLAATRHFTRTDSH